MFLCGVNYLEAVSLAARALESGESIGIWFSYVIV